MKKSLGIFLITIFLLLSSFNFVIAQEQTGNSNEVPYALKQACTLAFPSNPDRYEDCLKRQIDLLKRAETGTTIVIASSMQNEEAVEEIAVYEKYRPLFNEKFVFLGYKFIQIWPGIFYKKIKVPQTKRLPEEMTVRGYKLFLAGEVGMEKFTEDPSVVVMRTPVIAEGNKRIYIYPAKGRVMEEIIFNKDTEEVDIKTEAKEYRFGKTTALIRIIPKREKGKIDGSFTRAVIFDGDNEAGSIAEGAGIPTQEFGYVPDYKLNKDLKVSS